MQTIGAALCMLGLAIMALGTTIGSGIALIAGVPTLVVGFVVAALAPSKSDRR